MRATAAFIGAVVMAGLVLTLSPRSLSAHHAFAAEFDPDNPIRFEDARVVRVRLINPHSWIDVQVTFPDGRVETWAIEAGSPNILMRRGINKDTLKVGTRIIVDGYQAKDGSKRANGRDLTLPGGEHLFLGSPNTGAPYEVQRPGVDTAEGQ
jgi:Family of unknown function (DUF6152)